MASVVSSSVATWVPQSRESEFIEMRTAQLIWTEFSVDFLLSDQRMEAWGEVLEVTFCLLSEYIFFFILYHPFLDSMSSFVVEVLIFYYFSHVKSSNEKLES